MAKLKIFGDHKFFTQGVLIQKGAKKVTLDGKKATEYLAKFNMDEVCLYVFTTKNKQDTTSSAYTFDKSSAKPGTVFNINWKGDKNVFEVEIKGEFEREMDETDVSMLLKNGQTVDDVAFSIMGLKGGELFSKGFLSRIDQVDLDNLDVFPKIKFEFIP